MRLATSAPLSPPAEPNRLAPRDPYWPAASRRRDGGRDPARRRHKTDTGFGRRLGRKPDAPDRREAVLGRRSMGDCEPHWGRHRWDRGPTPARRPGAAVSRTTQMVGDGVRRTRPESGRGYAARRLAAGGAMQRVGLAVGEAVRGCVARRLDLRGRGCGGVGPAAGQCREAHGADRGCGRAAYLLARETSAAITRGCHHAGLPSRGAGWRRSWLDTLVGRGLVGRRAGWARGWPGPRAGRSEAGWRAGYWSRDRLLA